MYASRDCQHYKKTTYMLFHAIRSKRLVVPSPQSPGYQLIRSSRRIVANAIDIGEDSHSLPLFTHIFLQLPLDTAILLRQKRKILWNRILRLLPPRISTTEDFGGARGFHEDFARISRGFQEDWAGRNPREILAKSSRAHEILWVGVPEGHGREKQELEKKPFVQGVTAEHSENIHAL
jgi:hypothetical protein